MHREELSAILTPARFRQREPAEAFSSATIRTTMHLCYYLTSHGFGHSVRACAICAHLPENVHVTFRTGVPQTFFQVECTRPFGYASAAFDCGCLQSDSVTIDVERTLKTYTAIASRNEAELAQEIQWIRDNRIDGVICDIPPFPLEAAARAGVPSVAVANFTWHDIYREYLAAYPRYEALIDKMREQYAAASLLLEVSPSLPMPYFGRTVQAGVVGRPGHGMRERMCRLLGIDPQRKLALLYLGTFGMQMAWERLRDFSEWAFVSGDTMDPCPQNMFVFDKRDIAYQDVAASVDVVLSKLGYGIYSSCLLDGVPLIYLPRHEFAEYAALEAGVEQWGGGVRLSQEQFRSLEWGDALDAAVSRGRLPAIPDTGARFCADSIVELVKGGH
ncbi:MAG: hypothetical protein GF331_07830 [Chitinivibrionales bacterium]|nr:hypothetical protein [Chitinivibrionales bacterium]